VTAHSLAGRADLNGKSGVALSFVEDKGRCAVQFGSSAPVLIKPDNLHEVDAAESTDVHEELGAGLDGLNLLADPRWRNGSMARLQGLQARPELNGRVGLIVEWSAAHNRYIVELDGCNTSLKLRADNLSEADVSLTLLDDDRQPRDWPHRGGVDPRMAFASLFNKPMRDVGKVDSGPCQCERPTCPSRSTSCGICIDDPVLCWSCLRFFSLYCVGGGPDCLQRAGVVELGELDPESVLGNIDKRAKFKEWARCPRCDAALGAAAMPTVFRNMLSCQTFAQPGERFEPVSTEAEYRALVTEQMHAFSRANEAVAAQDANAAIKAYTRAIHCANHVRGLSPHLFDGDCRDTFLMAHARRALLEQNTSLSERIVAHFDSQGPAALRRYSFADASSALHSLLSLADIRGAPLRALG